MSSECCFADLEIVDFPVQVDKSLSSFFERILSSLDISLFRGNGISELFLVTFDLSNHFKLLLTTCVDCCYNLIIGVDHILNVSFC